MKTQWRETFLLYAEEDEYAQAIGKSRDNLREILAAHEKVYCSFSGGKDSTVLLDLALREDPAMMVMHIDFGRWLIPRPIFREICAIAAHMGCTLRIETSSQWEKYGRNLPKGGVFGKILFGRIEPQLVSEGFDCCLLGLRSQESHKRAARTRDKMWDFEKIHTAYPIAHLTYMDVWAHIVKKKSSVSEAL